MRVQICRAKPEGPGYEVLYTSADVSPDSREARQLLRSWKTRRNITFHITEGSRDLYLGADEVHNLFRLNARP